MKPSNSIKKKFYIRDIFSAIWSGSKRVVTKPFRMIRDLGSKLKPIKEKTSSENDNEGLIDQYLKEYEKNR